MEHIIICDIPEAVVELPTAFLATRVKVLNVYLAVENENVYQPKESTSFHAKPLFIICDFVKDKLVNGKNKPVLHVLTNELNCIEQTLSNNIIQKFSLSVVDVEFKPVKFLEHSKMVLTLLFT